MGNNYFLEELKAFLDDWVKRINELIKLPTDTPHAILDNELFSFDNKSGYSIKDDAVEKLLNAKICFVGDNPGDKEAEHLRYFYYEIDDNQRDERRAGSKIHKILEQIGREKVLLFNKCLIHTHSTRDLKAKEINSTANIVVDFLNNLSAANKEILFLFFGVNKKFSKIYSRLSKDPASKSVIYYHPCSSKYSENQLLAKVKEGKLIELNLNTQKHFFKLSDDEDDGLAGSVCVSK